MYIYKSLSHAHPKKHVLLEAKTQIHVKLCQINFWKFKHIHIHLHTYVHAYTLKYTCKHFWLAKMIQFEMNTLYFIVRWH